MKGKDKSESARTKIKTRSKVRTKIQPDLVVITGMSGAGRTEAMHTFEDLGYFCIDNLPPKLLSALVSLSENADGTRRKLAVVCDIRGREFFSELINELDSISDSGLEWEMVFLESDTETLVNRFKASRRKHPLCEGSMAVIDGIEKERELLQNTKNKSNYVIDTSKLKPQDLRKTIHIHFDDSGEGLKVKVLSFGFKYGLPIDADIVIDVRFLPNPYYEEDLRPLSGLDKPVKDFIFKSKQTQQFLRTWRNLLDVVMPGYVQEDKKYVTIALGCTGGQHRSVALACDTCDYLASLGFSSSIEHRDIYLSKGE